MTIGKNEMLNLRMPTNSSNTHASGNCWSDEGSQRARATGHAHEDETHGIHGDPEHFGVDCVRGLVRLA